LAQKTRSESIFDLVAGVLGVAGVGVGVVVIVVVFVLVVFGSIDTIGIRYAPWSTWSAKRGSRRKGD
jgi:hypothetical protein